ncbi:hypothetical protein LWI29_011584 [Acer saccharum]|uniref:Uncharacterized protein n=1 Tax=Acer saccharum TaxID=4024 RepID=A0AA39RQT3_ACESA|nr:hypothetical protein LWI29_011584 [Acer saccharum]KAK1555251.1 hypothetical protein Q3G72_023982 [Acer saccharum]
MTKLEELAMESISGDVAMKRLCDISNLLPQTEPANQEAKPKQLTSSVDLLVKQLRTEWQDLQKQNSQLAQRYRNSWKQLVSFKLKLLGKVTTSTCLHCEKQMRAHRCHEASKYFEVDNGDMNKSSLPVQTKGKKVNYRRFVSKGKKK